jgi:hypothetical protein
MIRMKLFCGFCRILTQRLPVIWLTSHLTEEGTSIDRANGKWQELVCVPEMAGQKIAWKSAFEPRADGANRGTMFPF